MKGNERVVVDILNDNVKKVALSVFFTSQQFSRSSCFYYFFQPALINACWMVDLFKLL